MTHNTMEDQNEALFTRCPNCQTTFRLPPSLLEVAQGRVRCSRCSHAFDGIGNRVEAAPIAAEPAPAPAPAPEPAADHAVDADVVYGLDQEPIPRRRSLLAGIFLTLIFLLLLALLGWQAYHALRDPMLASPTARPWIEQACEQIGCQLPPLHDPTQIVILSRNVQSHPDTRDALLINLTMVNRAPFEQPFPSIGLAFSNLDSSWSAQRTFPPEAYRSGPRNGSDLMPRDVPQQVVLELVDPGDQAISFRFDLL